ncbi:hypothetical protein [Promicromonospora sp. NPDC023987]|uniref:hypothetical protein n=1 Tax=Promicromonospora sp. NPDC023987 TaxID=3155360 RepID=UPI0033FA1DF5
MTVALGLVCSDGVLVASDSMGSNNTVADHSVKVRASNPAPVVWTAAGSVYVIEEVEAALASSLGTASGGTPPQIFFDPNESAIRGRLRPVLNKTMGGAYASALHVAPASPGGMTMLPFASDFLLLGYANGTPWFLEFAQDGQVNSHSERGFYAVGSGGHFASVARALMKHYLDREIPLELGRMLAYRTIATTVEVSPGGVGLPVQIAECNSEGPRILTTEEIEAVGAGVDAWKTLERESLRIGLGEVEAAPAGDLPSLAI